MAWTSTDLANLETAIAEAATRGYAEVKFGDQQARRYELSELRALRREMAQVVGGSSGAVMATYGQFSKG